MAYDEPKRRGRLGDTVVRQLVDRVVAGDYPAQSLIPNEAELCDEFAVSRTVVRESIKLLEEKGLVRASSGLGTRVLDGQKWNLLDPVVLEATIRHDASLKILDELVSVRAALEADMAAEAARQIGSADRADLTARVALLKSLVNDHAGYLAAGLSFHEKVMALSGNRLGQSIVHSILDKAHLSLAYRGTPTQKDFEQTQAEHEEMQRHIASGDPDKAATATRSHIVDAWARRRPTAARPTRSS